jgi:hypothetical protein
MNRQTITPQEAGLSDLDIMRSSMPPAWRRNMDRRKRVWNAQERVYRACPWMRWNLPTLMYAVWVLPIDEGIKDVFTPRWGAITFGFLNDGMKPTLWFTLLNLVRNQPIHPSGAPTFRQWLRGKR